MELQILVQDFTVCKPKTAAGIDLSREFCFVGKTDDELSLVCETQFAPAETTAREDGWKAMRIVGMLDFSLVGILAGIAGILAENGISIFAVSTYNTDYILVKREVLEKATLVLKQKGYTIL
ncbi:MAG: ACT domain-containing protein [Clostridia bacterium]|nr:ACT domain-containing protein [Clostridia bacterium]